VTEEKDDETPEQNKAGLRIRDLRIERNMSQEELADVLGMRK
jgi:DNA-binding XRE family transcriptional regulator